MIENATIFIYFLKYIKHKKGKNMIPLIARFMGPTWGPAGADRTQVGPMLAPWTLLSGTCNRICALLTTRKSFWLAFSFVRFWYWVFLAVPRRRFWFSNDFTSAILCIDLIYDQWVIFQSHSEPFHGGVGTLTIGSQLVVWAEGGGIEGWDIWCSEGLLFISLLQMPWCKISHVSSTKCNDAMYGKCNVSPSLCR